MKEHQAELYRFEFTWFPGRTRVLISKNMLRLLLDYDISYRHIAKSAKIYSDKSQWITLGNIEAQRNVSLYGEWKFVRKLKVATGNENAFVVSCGLDQGPVLLQSLHFIIIHRKKFNIPSPLC